MYYFTILNLLLKITLLYKNRTKKKRWLRGVGQFPVFEGLSCAVTTWLCDLDCVTLTSTLLLAGPQIPLPWSRVIGPDQLLRNLLKASYVLFQMRCHEDPRHMTVTKWVRLHRSWRGEAGAQLGRPLRRFRRVKASLGSKGGNPERAQG